MIQLKISVMSTSRLLYLRYLIAHRAVFPHTPLSPCRDSRDPRSKGPAFTKPQQPVEKDAEREVENGAPCTDVIQLEIFVMSTSGCSSAILEVKTAFVESRQPSRRKPKERC